MNQTYIIQNLMKNTEDKTAETKKYKLKTKLGKLRERTQQLLQNHSWRKYFETTNSTMNNFYLVSSSNEEISSGENIFRKNEVNNDCCEENQKSVFAVNSKLPSFLNQNTSNCNNNNNLLLTPIENYFLTNSNTQLNLFDETPIVRIDKKTQMDFFETPNYLSKINDEHENILVEKSFPLTPVTTQKYRKQRQHQSLTFIGELASTSTPTQKSQEPITSTPNASTHNPLIYHPSRTIRNKKLKRKLFEKETSFIELGGNNIFKQHKNLFKLKTDKKSSAMVCHQNRHHHHHHHHYNNMQQQHIHCPCLENAYKLDRFYEIKRLAHSSPKVNQKVKSSNMEKRLKDLLYTPNKLKHLIRKQQQQIEIKNLKNYYRYKSEISTPSNTPAKAGALQCTSSKIYYL